MAHCIDFSSDSDIDTKLRPLEVHVWKASLSQSALFLRDLIQTLSPDEKKRCEHLSDENRKRFSVGRGILRILLGRYSGIKPHQIEFSYLANGKPLLKENMHQDRLEFNLSHSNEIVLYVFGLGSPLGIDLEYLRPVENIEETARRILSSREYSYFSKLSDHEKLRAFFRFWTCKEASFKAGGRLQSLKEIELSLHENADPSYMRGLKEYEARYLREFEPEKGYWASLCVDKNVEHVSYMQTLNSG